MKKSFLKKINIGLLKFLTYSFIFLATMYVNSMFLNSFISIPLSMKHTFCWKMMPNNIEHLLTIDTSRKLYKVIN